LQRAIASAIAGGWQSDRTWDGALRIFRPSLRPPYCVLVVPLPSSNAAVGVPAGAVVFLDDPTRRPTASIRVLCKLFGLTPGQARVLALLVAGRSLQDAASQLGISAQTAKTHLKALLLRTETHRQADLVRLVMSSPGVLHVEADIGPQDDG
jgi:DNA-binding CsgD family transcriptional regulator